VASSHTADGWNGPLGERWARSADFMDRLLAPFTETLLHGLALKPGERALDIGCGAGATTLHAAKAVGPDGLALGLDVSAPLVEVAAARARNLVSSARFVLGDAAAWADETGFDAALSRFGVMFFSDPVAAFANIRALMAPQGRAVWVAWRSPAEAELFSLPMQTALAFLTAPPPPSQPGAPGPFGLSDPDRTRHLMETAGWHSVKVTPHDRFVSIRPEDRAGVFDRTALPALLEEQGVDPAPVRAALEAALAARADGEGVSHLKAGVWLIGAIA